MAYFKIGEQDFSNIVNSLKIGKEHKYTAQSNAAGNTVVDYIGSKRKIEVGIIPLDDVAMLRLLRAVDAFSVSISFRNPATNDLEEGVPCIIPSNAVDYYTIRVNKVSYKGFTLTFTEL